MTKIGLSGAEMTTPNPDAESYRVSIQTISYEERTLNGMLKTQFISQKHRWTVTWQGLSGTTLSGLKTELERLAHLKWYPPDEPELASGYNVKVQNISYAPLTGSSIVESISCELEEV